MQLLAARPDTRKRLLELCKQISAVAGAQPSALGARFRTFSGFRFRMAAGETGARAFRVDVPVQLYMQRAWGARWRSMASVPTHAEGAATGTASPVGRLALRGGSTTMPPVDRISMAAATAKTRPHHLGTRGSSPIPQPTAATTVATATGSRRSGGRSTHKRHCSDAARSGAPSAHVSARNTK
eukprot:3852807-Prymnesium_polylepis.1